MKHNGYRLSVPDSPQDVPRKEDVSAVFLFGFQDGRVLAARNERGWDVPGGRLEAGEDLQAGLRREVDEEAGASFQDAVPFAWLTAPESEKKMVFFACGNFQLTEFVPKEDAFERALLEPWALLRRYHGDRSLLARLLSLAAAVLGGAIETETGH